MTGQITPRGFLQLFIPLLLCLACTNSKVTKEKHTLPTLPSYLDQSEKIVMLSVSGPLHGSLLSQVVSVPNGEGGYSLDVHRGGLLGLAAHLNVLDQKYGSNVLKLSTGNFTSPSLSKDDTKRLIEFYRSNKYDGVLLSAKDWGNIQKYRLWDEAQEVGLLNASWFNIKTGKNAFKKGLDPYTLIEKGGKRFAIIGLTATPDDRPDPKLAPEVIREEPVASFLRVLRDLRREKVDYRILLLDVSTNCQSLEGGASSCTSPQQDQLRQFLKRLPPNSVDLIIAGGKNFYQGELEGLQVLQAQGGGHTLALRELIIDKEKAIEPKELPYVMLCHNFFQATNDCYFETSSKSRDERLKILQGSRFEKVPAKFLGFEVKLDPKWRL